MVGIKIYQSKKTYLPFIYLYIFTLFIVNIYHCEYIFFDIFRPYLMIFFINLNTLVYRIYKKKLYLKNSLHRNVYESISISIYGILFNLIHEMIFQKHLLLNDIDNIIFSLIYIFLNFVLGYYFKSSESLLYLHLLFLLIPIRRIWRLNIYIYVILITLSTYLLYSKIKTSDIKKKININLPILRYFIYLRIHNELIVLGFFQIYLEYYLSFLPFIKASSEIEELIFIDTKNS